MPIGVLINSSAILSGGIIGALAGSRIPERINTSLTGIFGLSAITMGLSLIIQLNSLAAVVMAMIVGALVGELIGLEDLLNKGLTRLASSLPGNNLSEEQLDNLISMIILFCFSGTGLFGAMNSAITGDHSILIAKAIMDFFTAIIFGAVSGYLVGVIAIPQVILGCILFYAGNLIIPFLSDYMVSDFKAVGGVITMAVGMKIAKTRYFRVLNMVPALILVFLFSRIWELLPF